MGMEQEEAPNLFKIGEKDYQNLDGYLADEEGDLILHFKEKIPIQVDPHPIVSAIHAMKDSNGNRIYSIPSKPKEERFAKVVEAMTDMHRTDGRFVKDHGLISMEKARSNPQAFAHAHERQNMGTYKTASGKIEQIKFGSERNYSKFLTVGDDAGIMAKRKAIIKPAVPRTIKAKAVEENKKEFGALKPYEKKTKKGVITKQPDPYIVKWQKARGAQKGAKFTDRLWKALKYLNLDTEDIVHPHDDDGNPIPDEDRKAWLTKLMAKPTFKARDGKLYHFGSIDFTIPDDPKYSGLVFDRKIPTHNFQGEKISKPRSPAFGLDKNRQYVAGSQGARMPLIASLKGFLDANGWNIGDNVGVNMWALKTTKAKYGQIKMKAKQIVQIVKHLRNGADGNFNNSEYKFKTLDWYNIDEDTYTDWDTNQSDWKDALAFFIIGLQVGWRSQEAFTAVAKIIPDEDSPASGIFIKEDEDLFVLRIYTRKTAHVGRKFQGGFILREDTGMLARKIILDRIAEVRKGIGIDRKLPNGEPNSEHALIGVDGRYTKVGTMGFPADARFTDMEIARYNKAGRTIPEVKPTQARERIRAILSHNFTLVGLHENYWHTHSGHAVRHTFAQLWMKKSGQNLLFVKDWGHWAGVDVLEKYYAQPTNAERVDIAKGFNSRTLGILEDEEDVRDKETEAEHERLRKIFEQEYGEDSKQPDPPPESLPSTDDPDAMPDDDDDTQGEQ